MANFLTAFSSWTIPLFLFFVLLLGFARGVRVYEAFVAGAKEGIEVSLRVFPFLVGMLTAVAVFRASGAFDLFSALLTPFTRFLGIPSEVLPLALMRPISGGGALGIAAELIKTYGPDSFLGRLASVAQGSTDTTFYIITVYFGSVGITRYRYAIPLGLTADLASFLAAVLFCRWMFPS